jgi:hypothetical protein
MTEKVLDLSALPPATGKPITRKMNFIEMPGGKIKRLKGKRGGVTAERGRKWEKWPDGPLDRKINALGDPCKKPEDLHPSECRLRAITEVGTIVPRGVNGHPVASAFCDGRKTVIAFRVEGRSLKVAV